MATVLFFNFLLLAVCGYAAIRGGAPERIVAGLFFAAALATIGVQQMRAEFSDTEVGTLIVDALLLVALFAVSLQANRYWPLWVTAIHTLAVAVHGVKIAEPSLLPAIYSRAAALSSLPVLLLLAVGTFRHRLRLNANGIDPSWNGSWFRLGRRRRGGDPGT
jgi:hypothetical protein